MSGVRVRSSHYVHSFHDCHVLTLMYVPSFGFSASNCTSLTRIPLATKIRAEKKVVGPTLNPDYSW